MIQMLVRKQTDDAMECTAKGRIPFLRIGLAMLVLSMLALNIDLPVVRALRANPIGGEIRDLLALAESFAHLYAIAIVMALIWQIQPQLRRRLLRVACCVLIPGGIADVLKVSIGRFRPHTFQAGFPESVSETFLGVFPFWNDSVDSAFNNAIQSFPSGHSATAVGFAIGLSWIFPRGRYIFALLALLAMAQRIHAGVHFPSDTLFSAGVACVVGRLLLYHRTIDSLFVRFESATQQAK
jgi:membrane-associated phospholipid phosphatase